MGRLAAYVAGEVGCRIYPRRSLAASARDRDGVGYSASILQVPLSPIPPRGLSASRSQTGTTVGFEGFEGGEPGARSCARDRSPLRQVHPGFFGRDLAPRPPRHGEAPSAGWSARRHRRPLSRGSNPCGYRTSCSSATGSIDNSPGGFFLPLMIRAFGAHCH
jgi:hypothetical protein